jgi:hypothetical protein
MYGNDGRRMVNDELKGTWKEAAQLHQYTYPAFIWRNRGK